MSRTAEPPERRSAATTCARRGPLIIGDEPKGVPSTGKRAIAPHIFAPQAAALRKLSAISSSVCSQPSGSTRLTSVMPEAETFLIVATRSAGLKGVSVPSRSRSAW